MHALLPFLEKRVIHHADVGPACRRAGTAERQNVRLQAARVLIVEAQADQREPVQSHSGKRRHPMPGSGRCRKHSHGFAADPTDVVLLATKLPGQNGPPCSRRSREPSLRNLKIILTATAGAVDEMAAFLLASATVIFGCRSAMCKWRPA